VGVEGVGYRGVKGTASASGASAGVWGSGGTGTDNYGVLGDVNAASGRAIYGTNSAQSGEAVTGVNNSGGVTFSAGNGIVGLNSGASKSDLHPSGSIWGGAGEFVGQNGVLGRTNATGGYGVAGWADNGVAIRGATVDGTAVVGIATGAGTAGSFTGNVNVSGTLSKGGGTFTIDHPLDPANKILNHSFVESPDMKNVYDGVVTLDSNGSATVSLPDYFGALNKDFRYQLTAIGKAAPDLHVNSEIKGNKFSIAGGAAGQRVSWQVTGVRQDAFANTHRVEVEVAKTGGQKGKYLHPKEHGQPLSKGIAASRNNEQKR
jgi:hypothetical protein